MGNKSYKSIGVFCLLLVFTLVGGGKLFKGIHDGEYDNLRRE